jgi:hypothetical protein
MKHLHLLGGTLGLAAMLWTVQDAVQAQQAGRGAGRGAGQGAAQGNQPPATARASAPFDPTGQWVSLITNNWRTRMVPPPRSDYADIPLNDMGRKIADAWDPAKDEAARAECKYYGAASIMFQPTRLRVTWQDDQTLRLDTDAGTQTRLFRFANATAAAAGTATATAPTGARTYQGSSVASWESRRPAGGGGGGGGGGRGGTAAPNPAARYLKVTTTNMLPGYLRKNGVPHSERASLIEYFDVFREPDGTTMMIVTIAVTDPEFLNQQYAVIAHFKKESDTSKWDPSPCSARW